MKKISTKEFKQLPLFSLFYCFERSPCSAFFRTDGKLYVKVKQYEDCSPYCMPLIDWAGFGINGYIEVTDFVETEDGFAVHWDAEQIDVMHANGPDSAALQEGNVAWKFDDPGQGEFFYVALEEKDLNNLFKDVDYVRRMLKYHTAKGSK